MKDTEAFIPDLKDYVHSVMAEAGWVTYKQILTEAMIVTLRAVPEHMTKKQAEEIDHHVLHAAQVILWLSAQMTPEEFKTCQDIAQGIIDGKIVKE